jgi:hypothetical protein
MDKKPGDILWAYVDFFLFDPLAEADAQTDPTVGFLYLAGDADPGAAPALAGRAVR